MKKLAGAAFATIQDYPSIAAGSSTFLVAFALVTGNALLGQPGGHPDPIWATRDAVTTQSVDRSAPRVPVHTVQTETFLPSVIPVPSRRPDIEPEPMADEGEQVREAQERLARIGLYRGKIDGVYGPVTRDAVVTFQRANGLEPDGRVGATLLEEIRELMSRSAVPDAPETARAPEPQLTPKPVQVSTVSQPLAAPVTALETPQSDEDIAKSARIARIQIGLMNFGEAGIAVDGVLGPHTVEAIRNFQERYGLKVSGEPDEAVIRKLEQIGALHNS